MFGALKQIGILLARSRKIWLLPVFLLLVIIVLLIVAAQIAPVPIFLYPII